MCSPGTGSRALLATAGVRDKPGVGRGWCLPSSSSKNVCRIKNGEYVTVQTMIDELIDKSWSIALHNYSVLKVDVVGP